MLPSAYQLPAAATLILGGLIACVAGYRLFRIVLGIYGFILGALLATSIVGPGDQVQLIVAAVIGGLIGALVLNLAYFVGVALVGAGAAALLLHIVWARVSHGDPHIIAVIFASVIGAVAATALQRLVIIVATAFGGAWTVVVGALALLGDRTAKGTSLYIDDVWVVYPLSPGPYRLWAIGGWIVLGIVGTAVQLRGKGPKKARAANRK